ncbi:MAG TPA: right-handed parallel beta-helix repeat-containing protein [Kiritimatiellia bacterium]|nr:right-handed parallel beta-helix repeat-containing protein [Kiritimatiellia bacterium]HPS07601.1 right-handed parallel beta-helix repeat-containing protein [Kiritimatiellia bacterium]
MKSTMIRIAAAACLAVPFCLTPAARAQGPLTPPGAPAPMMRTLVQVEPRTPIAFAGHTITQPGSYYLTTNLVTDWDGVIINANGVTLDLMGFALTGRRENFGLGITLQGATNAPIQDVVVRNGIIRNFYYGVIVQYGQNCRFEHLSVSSNSYVGIELDGAWYGSCDGNTIADCTFSDNDSHNIYLLGYAGRCNGNAIINCTMIGSNYSLYLHGREAPGLCNGNIVTGCRILRSSYAGIFLDGSTSGKCRGNIFTGCTIRDNGGQGILFYGQSGLCEGNIVTDCAVNNNANYGIELNGAASGQCIGNTVANCTVSDNGSYGLYLNAASSSGVCDGNVIAGCTVRENTTRGISLSYADGNRVEGNHISGQTGSSTYGIYCSGTSGNLFFRNTCVGQTNNFSLSANDTYGPIVTNKGALPTTSGNAAVSPWANFSR